MFKYKTICSTLKCIWFPFSYLFLCLDRLIWQIFYSLLYWTFECEIVWFSSATLICDVVSFSCFFLEYLPNPTALYYFILSYTMSFVVRISKNSEIEINGKPMFAISSCSILYAIYVIWLNQIWNKTPTFFAFFKLFINCKL